MSRYSEARREPEPEGKRHWGFSSDGRFFRSDAPVDNALTRYIKGLVGRVRSTSMTPAEAVWDISREPEHIRRAFDSAVLGAWSTRDRLDHWPHVPTGSTLLAFIASWGHGDAPPWRADPWQWERTCDAWEGRTGAESRFSVALRGLGALEVFLGEGTVTVARRQLQEAEAEALAARRGP